MAGAGDVNGDGRDDVVVGAYWADPEGRTDAGSAYVVFGRAGAPTVELALLGGALGFRVDGAAAGDRAGAAVAGDVNGDGKADVLAGAYLADPEGRTDAGSAYVVFGKRDGDPVDLSLLTAAGGVRIRGAAADDQAGYSLAGAGDVNGDGRSDVVLGAPYADNNARARSGSAYVVFGRAKGAIVDLASLSRRRGFRLAGAAGDLTAWSVAAAGDVNGDRLADVLVAAPFGDANRRTNSGSVYVVFGARRGAPVDLATLAPARGIRIDGAAADDNAGTSAAGAGDVDGDGRADVVVGAPLADGNGRGSSGSAYVVFTGPTA